MGSTTDQVLHNFLRQQEATAAQTMEKSAEAQVNEQLAAAFVDQCNQQGLSTEALTKIASEHPDTYQEMFMGWLSNLNERQRAFEKQAAAEKMAEAEAMEKVAEATFLGKVAAHAFIAELRDIHQFMMKKAEEEEEKEEEEEEEKKEEKDEKKEEKKEEASAALPMIPPEEKAAAHIPFQVERVVGTIEKKAAHGIAISPEEAELYEYYLLAKQGHNVNWGV